MNKFLNRLSIIILLIIISCKSTKDEISFKKINSDNSIIIKMNPNLKKITGIQFPFSLNINNLSSSTKEFIKIKYIYGFEEKGMGLELYEENIKISNNNKKELDGNQKKTYLLYSRHFTDSLKITQQQFKPYIEKMLEENKDTLHIGTITEFKKNHKELFEKLTKNDSISIQFLDGKKLGERITVPVQW